MAIHSPGGATCVLFIDVVVACCLQYIHVMWVIGSVALGSLNVSITSCCLEQILILSDPDGVY